MCVRSFGGWATKPQILKNAKLLENDLKDKNIGYASSEMFVAELSTPWEIVNRTNEISFKCVNGIDNLTKKFSVILK